MYVPLPLLAAAGILFLVLLFFAFRRDRSRDLLAPPRFDAPPRPLDETRLPPDLLDEVRALVARNRKIEAIKRVREATSLGLAEAKALVERL